MRTAKELIDEAEALEKTADNHERYEALWSAACHAAPSPAWATARIRCAETHIGQLQKAPALELLAPVRAMPTEIVGAEARAVARSMMIWAREVPLYDNDERVPLDEVAAAAEECEAANVPYHAASHLSRLASAARTNGNLDDALRLYQRAFAHYTAAGSRGAATTRVSIARLLRQRGDDDGALVELQWVGAYIGRQYTSSWQLIYNDVIALRAEIHAAAAVRLGSRAAAVAHYQHALELSGPITSSERSMPPHPRRDQQNLIDHRDRAELTPGNTPLAVTLDDLQPITVAFATRSWDAVLALASGVLASPPALSHPRTYLVAQVAREVALDALARGVDLDVLADSSWQLSRLFHCIDDPELSALSKLATEVLARRFGHVWFSARADAPT